MNKIRSGNSDKLRERFIAFLENKGKNKIILNNYSYNAVTIYFFEWSDVNRPPRVFDRVEEFVKFLGNCGIYLKEYEKEMVNTLRTVYITCYKNSKSLCIRSDYGALVNVMNNSHGTLPSVLPNNKLLIHNANALNLPSPSICEQGNFFG